MGEEEEEFGGRRKKIEDGVLSRDFVIVHEERSRRGDVICVAKRVNSGPPSFIQLIVAEMLGPEIPSVLKQVWSVDTTALLSYPVRQIPRQRKPTP